MKLLAGLLAITLGFGVIVTISVYLGLKADGRRSINTKPAPSSFSITEQVGH